MIVFDCSFSQPEIVSVSVDCRYSVCLCTNHDVRSCIKRIVVTRVVVCLENLSEKINTIFVAFWCTRRKSKRKMRREIRLPKNHTHPVYTNVSVGFSTCIIRIVKHKSYAHVRPPSSFGRLGIYFISDFFSIFHTNIIDVGILITRCKYVHGTASRTYNIVRFYQQYGVETDGMMGRLGMIDENNSLPD